MPTRLFLAFLLCCALILPGCATRTKMAFENDDERLTGSSAPVFLMTTTIKNDYHTSFQPKLTVVHVEKPDAQESKDRLNFLPDAKSIVESNAPNVGNTYLIRMQLEPGKYEIKGLTSTARSFPFNGVFFAPVHSQIQASRPGVFYLGHIAATVRERQGNEFKAGPSVPLIDQAMTGASGGTFDIEFIDRLAVDEKLFRAKFPVLRDAVIEKTILPPFDRAVAQRWWEDH